jgi:hypothetical protein
MNFFKKHADACAVIATIILTVFGSMIWMNSRFNEIDQRFSNLEKELAIVKTVMIMKNVMPSELASKE